MRFRVIYDQVHAPDYLCLNRPGFPRAARTEIKEFKRTLSNIVSINGAGDGLRAEKTSDD